MPPKKNTNTLYSKSNPVDIASLLTTTNLNASLGPINQLGGGNITKKNKKSKHDEDSESENESNYNSDSQYGSGEEEPEELEEEEEQEEEQEEPEELEEPEEQEEDDEQGSEKEEQEEEQEDDDEDKATVDTNNKCYSKYAKDDDDFDLDEYFKDDDIVITKPGRVGKPILFKYEMVRLLSDRSRQLAEGAKPMIKNTSGLSHKEIALLELKNKIIPLIIERPVPNSGTERWKLSELEIPEYD